MSRVDQSDREFWIHVGHRYRVARLALGLTEQEAAAAIGISASKFRLLVNERRMPSPRRLDGRKIWDVDELRAAFKALPHEDEEEADSWGDLA